MLKATKTSEKIALDRHVGEVAHRHGDVGAAGLLPELRDHRLGGVDAVHLEAALGEREREPAGADRELQHRAVAGELGEQLDARLLLEEARVAVPLVVDVGDAVAVGLGAVVVRHGRTLPRAERFDVLREALREEPAVVARRDLVVAGRRREVDDGLDVLPAGGDRLGPAGSPWPGTTCSGSSAAMRSRKASQFSGGKPRVRFRWPLTPTRSPANSTRSAGNQTIESLAVWAAPSSIATASPRSRSPVKVSVGGASSRVGTSAAIRRACSRSDSSSSSAR